jgi:hypothetical protein
MFAIDDRVEITQDIHKGKTGTIIDFCEDLKHPRAPWLVEFDGRTPEWRAYGGCGIQRWC